MKKKQATLLAAVAALNACSGDDTSPPAHAMPDAPAHVDPDTAPPTPSIDQIDTIVVIFAENRGFDNMYGAFPGANGIPASPPAQLDRDGNPLPTLPQTWSGVTAAGYTPVITQAMSDQLPNAPYALATTYTGFTNDTITRDLYHRFFENQMQIHGGANDMFAAYADSGGLVMGHHTTDDTAVYQLAHDFVLADNFFMGAFGGSFLNHQYLICACSPAYPGADTDPAKPTIAHVTPNTTTLVLAASSPASALDGPPTYELSGNLAPLDYFGAGTGYHAINTMQPPYQPSGNAPATDDATHMFADRAKATTLPPQSAPTIGDRLDDKAVTWAWYAGAFTSTTTTAMGDRQFPATTVPGSAPNFQFHHQPFNYYAAFDPATHAAARTAHLRDFTQLGTDAAAGTLPAVVFYKPEGDLNQHAGYASVGAGDQHLADVVAALQASPQYAHMMIVITYDENGGWWDHVAPPKGDLLGPGTRIPAIVVSPFAKHGVVDHTPYDTGSIQRLIARRFATAPLPGIAARDAALAQHGEPAMGDLTNALR